ncbi:MOSC domain-containing protein [Halorubrum ezzemoulense]|uniref:MOSC domain-containing protein n=1 Tax=Halorubrum ezzemoulense TaxID=337243 RepID=A0A256J922_HALEZ|nr:MULTISPECIES: MOSC domain-containing protein [Halorubrum]MDB9278862.1 MOSC domain-containing protein [Halorubrum ezzemoulense]MDB9281938.1 MOSC domain-containing protein [Halorubrum ezzemoulense]OYR62506.1 MOSC domain-containing protein [Halorubrum ezzemoulense]OYR65056.1 MOSC domain-containing protein [Halorubrum ezzemoulense]OYR75976.1 MOSC domain-containing protein [Halorubrum ezzemoulense]
MPADRPPESTSADATPGAVAGLVTAPEGGAPPVRREAVEVRPDGVEGDRYRRGDGHFQLDGCAVTLVAGEALTAVREATGIDVRDGRHRRNVVVEGFGAEMDSLLGATVAVGDALLRPTRRRPPCAHLEELAGEDGLASALRNRGGLCCDVVEPGSVAVGDPVTVREADPRTAGAAIADRLRERSSSGHE